MYLMQCSADPMGANLIDGWPPKPFAPAVCRRSRRDALAAIRLPPILDGDALHSLEVSNVSGDEPKTVDPRRGGDERILDSNPLPPRFEIRQDDSGSHGLFDGKRQNRDARQQVPCDALPKRAPLRMARRAEPQLHHARPTT